MLLSEVKTFIDENILHSEAFDNTDERRQQKAINTAESVLYSYYGNFKPDSNPLPTEAVAYQTIYLLGQDDSIQRTKHGVTYVGFSGVAMNLAQVNRQISPDVIRLLGRKVGSYSVSVSQTRRGLYER